jgi:hypothetical protein
MKKNLLFSATILSAVAFQNITFANETSLKINDLVGYVSCAYKTNPETDDVKVKKGNSYGSKYFSFTDSSFNSCSKTSENAKAKNSKAIVCAQHVIPIIKDVHCLITIQKINVQEDNNPAFDLSWIDSAYGLKLNMKPDGSISESDNVGILRDKQNRIYYVTGEKSPEAKEINFKIVGVQSTETDSILELDQN